jgi:hypothetical protein
MQVSTTTTTITLILFTYPSSTRGLWATRP